LLIENPFFVNQCNLPVILKTVKLVFFEHGLFREVGRTILAPKAGAIFTASVDWTVFH